MKKLLIIILLVLFPAVLFAETYCQWSGTEAENCRTLPTDVNFIRIPPDNHAISIDAANLSQHGYYLLVTTQPVVGADQVRDQVVWGFAANEISQTWTVRDMTTTEIDIREAGPMSRNDYFQWNALVSTGLLTGAQIQTYLQNNAPELVDAYLARDRLENP